MTKRKLYDWIFKFFIIICASLTFLILITIIVFIVVKGISGINFEFLTSVTSYKKGTVGIAGNIVNTLIIVVITILIAMIVGLSASIYLNFYATNKKLVKIVEFAIEVLSGIPSIIFGLFGMMFFGQTLGLGYSLLTGAFTLTLMILPLIIRSSQVAFFGVNKSYFLGSVALGATKWYTIRKVMIPSAISGILTGAILAIGRIVGESALLLFTAGASNHLAKGFFGLIDKLFQSGATLSVKLYLSATSEADFDTSFSIALVLLVIVFMINISAKVLAHFLSKK